jgi:hypothetical protein
MTAYAGGPQIQNYLDPNRPDYGAVALSGALTTSALERALMKLNSEVAGAEQIFNARVKAAKSGAADASRIAGAETFAAGAQAIGTAASGFIGAIPKGGGLGNTGNTKYGLGGGAGQGELIAPLSTGDNALSLLDSFLGRKK